MSWLFQTQGRRGPSASTSRPTWVYRAEQLEDRSVPAANIANIAFTPNNFGGGVFNPFPNFTGQVNTTSGDVNGDGVPDIITAEGVGPGSQSEVRIFDGAAARTQQQAVVIADFFAYSDTAGASQTPGFGGGVFVAAADFNGDGVAELVTSTGAGGDGHIKIFDFKDSSTAQFLASNPTLKTSFYAYPGFLGDIRVTTARLAGNLPPALVTASGAGMTQSDIRVYSDPLGIGSVASGTLVPPTAQAFVFPGYLGGVSIAAGDTNRDGTDELFVSTNMGTPTVTTYFLNSTNTGGLALTPGATFHPTSAPQGDIRLGVADINGDGVAELLVSNVGPTGASPIQVFSVSAGGFISTSSLTGFQGFGFFGNSWLASSTFGGPMIIPTGVGTSTTFSNTGLNGIGLTTGLTGFGTTGLTNLGTAGLTGFGMTSTLGGFASTPGLTGFATTPGVGTLMSFGSSISPTQNFVLSTFFGGGTAATSQALNTFGSGLIF